MKLKPGSAPLLSRKGAPPCRARALERLLTHERSMCAGEGCRCPTASLAVVKCSQLQPTSTTVVYFLPTNPPRPVAGASHQPTNRGTAMCQIMPSWRARRPLCVIFYEIYKSGSYGARTHHSATVITCFFSMPSLLKRRCGCYLRPIKNIKRRYGGYCALHGPQMNSLRNSSEGSNTLRTS